MLSFFVDYLDRLTAMHGEMEKAIAGLPLEALDWSPGPEMNSMAVLAVHTAGAERYWIGDVIGQDPSGRVREQEFETMGLTEAELRHKLQTVLAHSQRVLAALSLEELAQRRYSSRDDKDYSAGWALVHALEHTAVHTGHLQIMRQLWEQENKRQK